MDSSYYMGTALTKSAKAIVTILLFPIYIGLIVWCTESHDLLTRLLYVLIIATLLYLTFGTTQHLQIDWNQRKFRSAIRVAGINIGSWYFFDEYKFAVLKFESKSVQYSGTVRTSGVSFKLNQKAWVIEVWNPISKDIYHIFHGTKSKATEIITEISRQIPDVKTFKYHIKNGNEYDFKP